ncbi:MULTISPECIES: AraC family transcriptional regulator [Sorangium]|uniref:AraC family transcriptional regulator n=1 Tax=Sorangium cellulosum TaxID=56 RepID=A0A4V0NFA3_SORCE|nr:MULTISPECIES: AraC family transcriptional regulator [Sorangium]AUX28972.1 AraC family transcriptional regulator [Sorangium cellulosum]WCQ88366.1 IS5 family transposase IS4811 [Sorangium sp. Soce836]
MDILTETLRSVQLRSQIYGRLELKAPWGMRVDGHDVTTFYALSRGGCVLDVGGRRLTLAPGDVVFLRARLAHALRDRPGSRAVSPEEVYAQRGGRCGGIVRYGGEGAPTTIVAGGLHFTDARLNPLVASLPELIHVKGDGGVATRWLESTLQFVAAEMDAELPGHELVAGRLADVLFVQALRTHVAGITCEESGWLRALWDPTLGVALQRMHERPADPWTVEALARAAGVSRSAFAARFKGTLGLAPLEYLTRWRMHRAAEMLADEAASTAEVAGAVGYDTDGAFVKAFKRHMGETPGAYRRKARARESR